jgi:uncharacterized membrane protein
LSQAIAQACTQLKTMAAGQLLSGQVQLNQNGWSTNGWWHTDVMKIYQNLWLGL